VDVVVGGHCGFLLPTASESPGGILGWLPTGSMLRSSQQASGEGKDGGMVSGGAPD
jgi:hypothetical protein